MQLKAKITLLAVVPMLLSLLLIGVAMFAGAAATLMSGSGSTTFALESHLNFLREVHEGDELREFFAGHAAAHELVEQHRVCRCRRKYRLLAWKPDPAAGCVF